MTYELACKEEAEAVYDVVQRTIKTIYPKYYPTEVVEFFCAHHSRDAILKDIAHGDVSVWKVEGKIVAPGCFVENHITRVYVLPEYQRKGYGTQIIKTIEAQICDKYDRAYLDASLPAAALYEKLGFQTIKHERHLLENGVVLAYEVMEKTLCKGDADVVYEGRRFVPKQNSANGEVDAETFFVYHQTGRLLWGEYAGGDILKGFLLGTVQPNGELDFVYQHINRQMQGKTGKCHSVPVILEDGKIELKERWKWTNGDCSEGESLLIEV